MLLHHMHSELLLLVHSLQVVLMAQGVRHCLALWLAAQHNTHSILVRLPLCDDKPGAINVFGLTESKSHLLINGKLAKSLLVYIVVQVKESES